MPSPVEAPTWRLEWDESLSMGILEIDADHQQFIRLVNELNQAIVARMEGAEIKKRLQSVIDDATSHFAHEEALFKEWNYPETMEHAHKHAQIILVLREIMGSIEHDLTEYGLIEAGLKVKAALIAHLLTEDIKYRDYRRREKSGGSS